ncbi:MAG TPA: ATP-binding protein [Candidatus Limnocylindria bacterium]|nr:ATP-binding protein [Candidatus Limnocylindria bacterium]
MPVVDVLRELFETNRIIVLTVYGQVFFVLGLAVALQSLKRSTLALARPLPWLAAFGIVHGFHEWGYLFIPIQSGYLPLEATEALLVLQLIMKGASFALLLQFGVELLAAITRYPILPRLRLLPAVAFLAWTGATLAVSAAVGDFRPDAGAWLPEGRIAEALANVGAPLAVGDVLGRWMLALPGAALAAWGLLSSASAVRAVARPPVVLGLRAAAVAFGFYAVLGGVIGLPAPFPPASLLNGATVLDALGIPIEVLRSGAGLVIAIAIILALDLFEQETDRALAEARRRELLARERERIGRDLHDGILQSIYAAGLHLEEANAALDASADVPRDRMGTVRNELERIGDDIRTTIFDLRSASLETRDAEEIVRAVADELRANTLVRLDLRVRGAWRPDLTAEQAEQLRQVVHEAFSNILRHARASLVTVRLDCGRRRLRLDIADDGIGFDTDVAAARERSGRAQGMRNMRRRAELLGASLDVRSDPGRGTELSLTMPVATRRQPA